MQGHRAVPLLALLGTTVLAPTMAAAQLASCADLLTNPPLAGNPAVFSATSTQQTTGGRAYCMVNVTWRDPSLVGSAAGYAPGGPPTVDTFQNIRLGIALPLNTNTGDAAWGGRLIMTAGGGAQGSVPGLTGMITMTPAAIGAGSDSGHGDSNSGSGDNWGVINGVSLNYGKVQDWAGGRSNGVTVKLAKQLAQTYYGGSVSRTYWNGCSGGGHMGWAQVQNYGDEYDGALIGAPAFQWQEFRQVDSWAALNIKKLSQQMAVATPISSGQLSAANAAANAACGGGTIPNAFYADPRACTFSAFANRCGQPGAPASPNCLTDDRQAATIDKIWDGPRNSFGRRIWQPYVRGIGIGTGTATAGSTAQVMRYNHFDTSFASSNLYLDQESINLAGNPANAITYENEALLGSTVADDYVDTHNPAIDTAHARGIKIMVYHGTQDPAILFNHDIDFYRRVATYFGRGIADLDSLRQWYRLYLVPGAPHCPSVPQALPALINWVENGIPPDSLAQNPAATGAAPLLCAFPQTAIYNGSGSTTDAANYTCGGNLETTQAVCATVRTKYKHETEDALDYRSVGVKATSCVGQPGF